MINEFLRTLLPKNEMSIASNKQILAKKYND